MPTEVGGTEIGITAEHYVYVWVRDGFGFRGVDIIRERSFIVEIAQLSVSLTSVGCEARMCALLEQDTCTPAMHAGRRILRQLAHARFDCGHMQTVTLNQKI